MLRKRKAVTTGAAALSRIVLVDANVFFAPRMRDLFMHLHEAEVIYVHWTKAIEEEWARKCRRQAKCRPRCHPGLPDGHAGRGRGLGGGRLRALRSSI